jgi:citrate synthase
MLKYVANESEEELIALMAKIAEKRCLINPDLFNKYIVKRGLRDEDGRGVLVGLTEIGEVHSYIIEENEIVPTPGRLTYRGIDINDIVNGFMSEGRFGFEETCYLLLMGDLPNAQQLWDFKQLIANNMFLPEDFVRSTILEDPSKDVMNVLARSVLELYSYDDDADDISIPNVLKQCLRLIACFPSLAVYGYQAFSHYHCNKSLHIHSPRPDLSIAENILHMLRPDNKYTKLEATLLDLALVLHAEHGGGNNSSFVTHVVTSSGTDTYSVIAASLGSLKGPKHGGANRKVVHMFADLKEKVKDWEDDDEIKAYLTKLLNREAFDREGKIYGIGHAVYSISDPRSVILKKYAGQLAKEKGLEDEYNLYCKVESLAPDLIARDHKTFKPVSSNVDFYSGFVYRMLELPAELFTPLFAVARIAGWSAHRLEELVNAGKIIRPSYKSVARRRPYIPMQER